jgi:hypothetical protein
MEPVLVRLVVVGSIVLGLGCAGDGSTFMEPGDDNGNDNGNGNGSNSGFAAQVQPIFTSNCALSGCHAGSNPAQGMNLSDGQAYANIVNVQSNESSLLRVKPGEPDESYLVHKIQGTQGSVGGSGGQMPLGGTPLTQAQIDLIREWITDGAPNN